MNKTGLKTFVFSFAITLSAILVADRAFLHPSQTTKEHIKIPRKNITLFFSQSHSSIVSSQTEPVLKNTLEPLDVKQVKRNEIKIAGNLPPPPKVEKIVKKEVFPVVKAEEVSEKVEIPELVEDKPLMESPYAYAGAKSQEVAENDASVFPEDVSDIPLVYVGVEEKAQSLEYAQKEILEEERPVEENTASLPEPEPLWQPKVITGTRQIVKIDNLKKKRELQKKDNERETGSEEPLVVASIENNEIPLQKEPQVADDAAEKGLIAPPDNQIASLGEVEPLVMAEEKVAEPEQEEREWQTMAEKHQDESPWVVARGSKFVKNKKVLEEEFASDRAKENAERLLPRETAVENTSVKVAVQDNLLIPIPQELLDEDDLVPTLGEDKNRQKSLVKKEEPKSFLGNIASVFSKENRERAIKNLKEKGNKLMNGAKDGKGEIRPQILPTEIRLSFQPNRAEISGQTLRWIQAFAKKAVDDDSVGLEIRIDGTRSFELQQKRLNLLYNILTANDVPYQKLNTVFSDREPNSFVVRTVKINNRQEKKEDDSWKKYYQKW